MNTKMVVEGKYCSCITHTHTHTHMHTHTQFITYLVYLHSDPLGCLQYIGCIIPHMPCVKAVSLHKCGFPADQMLPTLGTYTYCTCTHLCALYTRVKPETPVFIFILLI